MSIKKEKITIEPWHTEVKFHYSDFSFTLIIHGKRPRAKNDNRVEVHIKFKFWWIKHLRSQLKEVVKSAESQIDDVNN